jgi:hypothetical protein
MVEACATIWESSDDGSNRNADSVTSTDIPSHDYQLQPSTVQSLKMLITDGNSRTPYRKKGLAVKVDSVPWRAVAPATAAMAV